MTAALGLFMHPTRARQAYRIDRVRAVEELADTFSLPEDLDPVATLEDHLDVGWEYDVEVVIDLHVKSVGLPSPAPFDGSNRSMPRQPA